jgi:hypothetical protein
MSLISRLFSYLFQVGRLDEAILYQASRAKRAELASLNREPFLSYPNLLDH